VMTGRKAGSAERGMVREIDFSTLMAG
jgi:hypothetical protein